MLVVLKSDVIQLDKGPSFLNAYLLCIHVRKKVVKFSIINFHCTQDNIGTLMPKVHTVQSSENAKSKDSALTIISANSYFGRIANTSHTPHPESQRSFVIPKGEKMIESIKPFGSYFDINVSITSVKVRNLK